MSTDTVDIKVATPLPSNVVLTLGALIDAAWPNSQLAMNEDRFTNQVIFRIDNTARVPVEDADAAALRVDPDGIDVTSLGPDGVGVITSAEIAANLLPAIQAAFEKFPDAENYLEMPIHDPSDGHRYILTFARSKNQTPHQLRMAAERELAEARDRIHRDYAAAVWGVRSGPRPENAPDTFDAGVNAVLEIFRNLSHPVDGGDDD